MTEIQLLKTPDGRHPYLSRWCKSEPASAVILKGNGDHWAKLKHKATVLTLRHGDGDAGVAFWSDREPYNYKEQFSRRGQLLQREQQYNYGHFSSTGRRSFVETMIEGLDGEKPGHYLPHKQSKRNTLRSSANDRAREGFRYWVIEKPANKGGKYTTGARTTFLGLGKSFYP